MFIPIATYWPGCIPYKSHAEDTTPSFSYIIRLTCSKCSLAYCHVRVDVKLVLSHCRCPGNILNKGNRLRLRIFPLHPCRLWEDKCMFSVARRSQLSRNTILKLAPVLTGKSEKCRSMVRSFFCNSSTKTSTVIPIFYYKILIRTLSTLSIKNWQFFSKLD